jgi:aryl-alcohol dehydrogenase-like predicted oxidoreductase
MSPNAMEKIPRRDHGSKLQNDSLARTLPIVGLGCSSFSTFFWTSKDQEEILLSKGSTSSLSWTGDTLEKSHPRVQEWIRTIHFAVEECGINLLDTAPWYGHGTSEVVIGWALEDLLQQSTTRQDIIVNTKVGRYEADPKHQFDFSGPATLASVERSVERMKCQYIDVLQLHDPEFAPSLEQLMKETIPAMMECRSRGWCRALGMTGYPLEVQYQILQRTFQDFGADKKVWDQAMTYGHFNLHDSSLLNETMLSYKSFADYCEKSNIALLAAAPLSMGLLTHKGPPEWHPASAELASACRKAASISKDHMVDISLLAILYALSNPAVPCTILGCKNVDEVKYASSIANRFKNIEQEMPQEDILKCVLSETELRTYEIIMDPKEGPFAKVWREGTFLWDGVQAAHYFWKTAGELNTPDWQARSF